MQTKKFQRKIENFKCEHCGKEVKGSGYTNHCPNCLWSKHVDIKPGDRQESCQGMMEPISAVYKEGIYVIQQRCIDCKKIMNIKSNKIDNYDKIIIIVSNS
ncbi:MAG: RNHCP domain-containing protein [Candidatus Kerfeldbacteria bacterium]|jgi:RNHCP domain-containing protein